MMPDTQPATALADARISTAAPSAMGLRLRADTDPIAAIGAWRAPRPDGT